IYCVFEARPFEEFTGWHHTNPEIEDNLKIDHKSYSSLAKTEKAELILDGQKIECTLGQRSKVVEIS
uniref:Uncharacterized protein n=1 Tax=Trichobilharzia regenti TaxID=157069 RepID=A0AA85K6J7_TRIRE